MEVQAERSFCHLVKVASPPCSNLAVGISLQNNLDTENHLMLFIKKAALSESGDSHAPHAMVRQVPRSRAQF